MQIGVVGAGLVGRLIAWKLLRAGHQITLFDRDNKAAEQSAAKVAAAMIAPYSEVVSGEREIFEWGLESLQQWPSLLRQLESDSALEVYFQHRGSIVVAHRQDQAYLDHFNQLLRSRVPNHLEDIEFLNAETLATLEPGLVEKFSAGTFLKQEACLGNWELLKALATAIANLGGEWLENTEVVKVRPGEVVTAEKCYPFDLTIDCRGFRANVDLPDLRGVRGEVIWVRAAEVSLSRPVRLMHPRYQLYIAPKPDHVYVIGATEIESESLEPITVRSSLELQSALYSIDRGFAEAHILKSYANCRPAFTDNLPRVESEPGLIRINGLYRHGYLLSPIAVGAALEVINGDDSHPMVFTDNQTNVNVSA